MALTVLTTTWLPTLDRPAEMLGVQWLDDAGTLYMRSHNSCLRLTRTLKITAPGIRALVYDYGEPIPFRSIALAPGVILVALLEIVWPDDITLAGFPVIAEVSPWLRQQITAATTGANGDEL